MELLVIAVELSVIMGPSIVVGLIAVYFNRRDAQAESQGREIGSTAK